MTHKLKIDIVTPIGSVALIDGPSAVDPARQEMEAKAQALDAEKARFTQLCDSIGQIAGQVKEYQKRLVAEHRGQIAALSVKIAEKILLKEIANGDYKIDEIIQESLNKAPQQQDVTVRLNPEDLKTYQEIGLDMPDVEFVADSNLGRAECVVDSDKGSVENYIDEHLKQVANALGVTE